MSKVIFHIDLNAFFASCEAIDKPHLANVPMVVTGEKNSVRGVVTTANYAARKYGIHSAMPVKTALRKFPKLEILGANFAFYRDVSHQFITILKQYSPLVEQASIDEAYIDMSHYFPQQDAMKIAKHLQHRLQTELKIGSSIGIAPNKFLAKMASDMKKPNGITILRKKDIPAKLWPLPLGNMYGIGKASIPRFAKLGIETIRDLAQYEDTVKLIHFFGPHVMSQVAKANGNCTDKVDPKKYETPTSIGHSTTFNRDYILEAEILEEAKRMCSKTSARLKRHNLYAKTITLQIKYANFKNITRSKTVKEPIQNADDIYFYIVDLFEEYWDESPVRLIGASTSNLEGEKKDKKTHHKLNLFNYKEFEKEEKLRQTVRDLNARFEQDVIKKGVKVAENSE